MSDLKEQIELLSEGAQGGFGPLYYHVLPKLINEGGYEVGAEVGVCLAGNSEGILEKTGVKLLHSVDPYIYQRGSTDGHALPNGKIFTQVEYDAMYEFSLNRLSIFGGRSKFHRLTSIDAAKQIEDGFLDFVFIDAIHTYQALKEDIAAWLPKVRVGGMISGHDMDHPNFPGIRQAVAEAFGNDFTKEDGYVWWTIKK